VLIALVVLVLSGTAHDYFERGPTPFDQVTWCLGESPFLSKDAPRLRMADGLVGSRSLLGKNAQDVKSLLGPPTKTDKFKNFDLVYWLGPERGWLGVDSEWLLIRFGNGKVVEANIVRD
jgi:hypothetical protein